MSERRSSAILSVNRKSLRYRSVQRYVRELRRRIKELVATRIRYGHKRINVLPRREG